MSAAAWARGRILAALAFLAWLDERGTTLGAATQADIDDWLHGATQQRYLLRDFPTWASARRLAGQVTVPALPRSELTGLITEDSRWQLLSRCLRDPGIPLEVLTAGALLLLYGQFVSRLTRLTAADIEQHGPDTCLRLDTVPVLLPPRLATLVRAQLDAGPARCPRMHSGRASVPLGRSVRTVGTVGTHRRRFHGRPRTGRASGLFRFDRRRPVGFVGASTIARMACRPVLPPPRTAGPRRPAVRPAGIRTPSCQCEVSVHALPIVLGDP
jgi:hypothetical protein